MKLTLSREELKSKKWNFLLPLIHEENANRLLIVPEETTRVLNALLRDNETQEGLTHTRTYFAVMKTEGDDMYLEYTMDFIVTDVEKAKTIGLFAKRLAEVGVYDSFIAYEAARVKALGESEDSTFGPPRS